MMPPGEIVYLDARAVRASVEVTSRAQLADLGRPTPCGDWTLAQLLAHMTAQHRGFAAAAAGHGADLVRWQTGAPAADPVPVYAAAAELVLGAFGAPGVLNREFELPEISTEIRFPAQQAIGFHFVDYVVHGWDVARALGVPYELAPDLLTVALGIARSVPDGKSRRRPGSAFAPRVAVTSAGPLDEIVALLGRRPSWPALPAAAHRRLRSGRVTVEQRALTGWTRWSPAPGWRGRPFWIRLTGQGAAERAVRRLLGLLRPRRQVRAAHREAGRRPGLRRRRAPSPQTPVSPWPPIRLIDRLPRQRLVPAGH